MFRAADFDESEQYRYRLVRSWNPVDPRVAFVLLNPSTADSSADDPTVRRCIVLARGWGFGSLEVVNLFAWRSPDPRALRQAVAPVGPANDHWLCRSATACSAIVVGWGNHGTLHRRDTEVIALLRSIQAVPTCLGMTASGQPRHPLYLRHDTPRQPFSLE